MTGILPTPQLRVLWYWGRRRHTSRAGAAPAGTLLPGPPSPPPQACFKTKTAAEPGSEEARAQLPPLSRPAPSRGVRHHPQPSRLCRADGVKYAKIPTPAAWAAAALRAGGAAAAGGGPAPPGPTTWRAAPPRPAPPCACDRAARRLSRSAMPLFSVPKEVAVGTAMLGVAFATGLLAGKRRPRRQPRAGRGRAPAAAGEQGAFRAGWGGCCFVDLSGKRSRGRQSRDQVCM